MRPHTYCMACGKVKTLAGPSAKGLGFYLSGLATLRSYLERSASREKMTESQGRLVATALLAVQEFEDPYALSLEAQRTLYVDAVQRVRPDLDEELILRLLPKVKRRPKKPLFDVTGSAPAT